MVRKKGDYTHKFTEEHLKRMFELGAIGTPIEDIAAELGINADTLRVRMKSDKKIDDAIRGGRRKAFEKARKTLFQMAFVEKNVAAAIFYAKTQLRWSEKQHIEISTTGPTVPNINFNFGKDGKATAEQVEKAFDKYLDKPQVRADEDAPEELPPS